MKIVTYNIRNWRNADHQSNLQQVLETLRAADADLIGLNEALHPHPSPEKGLAALDYLARELGMDAVFGPAFQPRNAFHFPQTMSGNALLSRWPILASAAHHLTPVLKNQRGLLEARVLLPDNTPLTIYVTHLEPKDEDARMQQAQAVLAWTIRDRGKPHILMGDLNTYNPADFPTEEALVDFRARAEKRGFTFFRAQVIPKLLKSGYVDACETAPRATWDTEDELWARLDYILLSRALAPQLRRCQTIDAAAARRASDHLPVMATLSSG